MQACSRCDCFHGCAGNSELEVAGPLTPLLNALPRVSIMDFRGVHKEKGANYWSDKK